MVLQRLQILELQKLYQIQQLLHLVQQLDQFTIFHQSMQEVDIQMQSQTYIHLVL